MTVSVQSLTRASVRSTRRLRTAAALRVMAAVSGTSTWKQINAVL